MVRPATENDRSEEALAAGTLSRLRASLHSRGQTSAASMAEYRRPLTVNKSAYRPKYLDKQ